MPVGDNRYCGVEPAVRRFPESLPTCERHKDVDAGHWDTRVEAPHCDFCAEIHPTWAFAGGGGTMHGPVTGTSIHTPQWWAACGVCKMAIEQPTLEEQLKGLLVRWNTYHLADLQKDPELDDTGRWAVQVELLTLWHTFLTGRDQARPAIRWADYHGSLRP